MSTKTSCAFGIAPCFIRLFNAKIVKENEIIITAPDGMDYDQVAKSVKNYGGTISGVNEYLNRYQITFENEYSIEELNEISDVLTSENIAESATIDVLIHSGIDIEC